VNRRSNSRRFAKNLYREIEFLEKVYNPRSYFLSKRYFKNMYVSLRSQTSLAIKGMFPKLQTKHQDNLVFSETFRHSLEVLKAHNQQNVGSFYPEST